MGNENNQQQRPKGNNKGNNKQYNPHAVPVRPEDKKRFNKNYFETNKQRVGENFLDMKNAEDLQRDALNIFRDVARRRLDVRMYPQYFANPALVEAMLLVATNKHTSSTISFSAMQFYTDAIMRSGQELNQHTINVYNEHKSSMEAYGIIVAALIEFKTFWNIEALFAKFTLLQNYRNYI